MGKIVIKKAKTGIKFDLKATNGQVVASSQVCERPTAYAYAKRRGLRAAYAVTGQTHARCPVSPGLRL